MAKNEISPRMKKVLEEGRAEARKRVVDRGIVQFRADPDMMVELLETSERRRVPLGTMLREWIGDRLRQEQGQATQSDAAAYADLCTEVRDKLANIEARQLEFRKFFLLGEQQEGR